MESPHRRRRFGWGPARPAAAVLLSAALLAACGGDEGVPPPAAQFVPDEANPLPGEVTLQVDQITGGLASLDVMVADVAGVHSASFDLLYDPSVARFDGFEYQGISFLDCLPPGSLLVPDPEPDQDQPGRVIFGMARKNSRVCTISKDPCQVDSDCPLSPGETCGENTCDADPGGELLIRLFFQVLQRATTRIDFVDSPAGEPPILEPFNQADPSLVEGESKFHGGTLTGI